MAKTLTATDRSALIRLASSMEKGSQERRAILAGLNLFPDWKISSDDRREKVWYNQDLRAVIRQRKHPSFISAGQFILQREGRPDARFGFMPAAVAAAKR